VGQKVAECLRDIPSPPYRLPLPNSCTFRFDSNKDVIDLGAAIHSSGPRQAGESERPAILSGSPWSWKL
jgi:hypothetical protein